MKHIMTLYKHNESLNSENPLQHPDSPERYQLFIVEEDDSDVEIEYDMGPRNPDDAIGEFPQLAFVENRNYKSQSLAEEEFLESQSETLEADGKRLIHVYCNTVIVNSSNFSIPMDNTDRINNIFQLIAKKTGRDKLNVKKYVIMIQTPHKKISAASAEAMDPFNDQDESRIIDPTTLVKNLKTNKIEIREKLFVDKPVHK